MSYMALYRKFRPRSFEEVKGQEHIVTTLKNQINANRIGHAYLFCGTRGTGKTSVAKIFAKAVNCEHLSNGSPCNECASCKAIAQGSSMNVIEIDAASNNGVDNIREIREEVAYSPTEGRYKVYIIDEVHMLSIGAFNALLKTLEEPPSYVIFVLATTEVHKIPITILSRCQRYDFRRISMNTLQESLQGLTTALQVNVDERALRYIAKAADGAMRDALSLFDQCLAFYMNQDLTYEMVLEVLGAVDMEVFSQMLRSIIAKDTLGCIKKLEEIVMSGKEITQFTIDFTWYMRNLLLIQTAEQVEDVLDVSTEQRIALQEEASMVESETLMRYIRICSELTSQIKYSSQKRVLTEIALIKLTKPQMEQDYEAILNRLMFLEQKIEQGVFQVHEAKEQGVMDKKNQPDNYQPSTELLKENSLSKAVPEDIQAAVNAMSKLISQLDNPMKVFLSQSRYLVGGDNRLIVVTEDEMAEGFLKNLDRKEELEQKLSQLIGKAITIDIQVKNKSNMNIDSFVVAQNKIHMNIDVED